MHQLVSSLIGELKRVDVGVLHDETQANGLAGEYANVGSAFPSNRTVYAVANDFRTIFETIFGNRLAASILNFHADAAGGGCGEVDAEFVSREHQRSGDYFAACVRSLN